MNRIIGFGLLFFLGYIGNVPGQTRFMDSHYIWTEYFISSGIQGSHHFSNRNTFDSTTTEINGKVYNERLTSALPTGDNWDHTQMFYRSDSTGKVYMSFFDFENVAFDYSLKINDTFSEYLVVTNVDSITLSNGEKRKQLTLRCIGDDDPPTGFGYKYWIEGLGSTQGVYDGYYSVYDECAFDADGRITLCISRNDTLIFDNPDYDSCWFVPTATLDINHGTISIFPNPASTVISIEAKTHQIQKVSVIDLVGNVIFIKNKPELDISFLPPGYYFLQIELENKQLIMKQFVKQ